jgi:hypothetical protein
MYLNVLDKEGRLLAKSAGITFVVAGQAAMRGHLAQQQGNYVLAKKHFKEALVIYRVYTSPTYTAWCLEGLASTIYAEGHYKPAARLYAAAAVLRKRDQTPLPTSENEAFLQVVDNQLHWTKGTLERNGPQGHLLHKMKQLMMRFWQQWDKITFRPL